MFASYHEVYQECLYICFEYFRFHPLNIGVIRFILVLRIPAEILLLFNSMRDQLHVVNWLYGILLDRIDACCFLNHLLYMAIPFKIIPVPYSKSFVRANSFYYFVAHTSGAGSETALLKHIHMYLVFGFWVFYSQQPMFASHQRRLHMASCSQCNHFILRIVMRS